MINAAHIKTRLEGLFRTICFLPFLPSVSSFIENGAGGLRPVKCTQSNITRPNLQQAGNREHGFTLIELSVVIVIIGLLVGGILVGRDLIVSAQLRSTLGQVDKYVTAVNAFRLKFNALPGDIRQSEATSFGLFASSAAATGQGDGNQLIEGGAAAATVPIGETIIFWRHLYEAGYVDGALGVQSNSVLVVGTGVVTNTVTTISQSLPVTKVTPENGFIVYSTNGYNYFSIMPIATITTAAYTFNTFGLTPINASNIDTKLDDGKPNVGAIIARGIAAVNATPSVNAASTASTCTIGAGSATDVYNGVIATGGNDTSCGVRIRFP